ncbi:hypothetical protein EHZ19_15880 [Paraburkholderia bannensis]|nr:hypothetical protein [Paraburkholderia bannensis]RQM47132.1 hypothetical protein EHZ19_15880 [Paraburkholderia bannensis]
MSENLIHYFRALERLEAGRPVRVPKGTRITNDAVALEAGRGKGSIKRSRPVFDKLIAEIARVAGSQLKGQNQGVGKSTTEVSVAGGYRELFEAALAREVSLLYELFEVKKQLAKVTGERVFPLRTQ